MKHIALALLVSAAAVATSSARADTRFSVGINVGTPSYRVPPPVVVYAPVAPRGYWKEIVVKTWVPERIVVRHNYRGHHERVCEPGYFTYRTDRVWIETDHRASRGYGYGSNRHDHNSDSRDYRDSRDHRDSRDGWNR